MSDPKTEIEQRLDKLERAVYILAKWVVAEDRSRKEIDELEKLLIIPDSSDDVA